MQHLILGLYCLTEACLSEYLGVVLYSSLDSVTVLA